MDIKTLLVLGSVFIAGCSNPYANVISSEEVVHLSMGKYETTQELLFTALSKYPKRENPVINNYAITSMLGLSAVSRVYKQNLALGTTFKVVRVLSCTFCFDPHLYTIDVEVLGMELPQVAPTYLYFQTVVINGKIELDPVYFKKVNHK